MPDSQFAPQDLVEAARRLLDSLGNGTMSETAYDTAWVARLPASNHPDEPMFPGAYDWLLRNQHADGSWGAEVPFAHDRLVCTLAALISVSSTSYRREESEPAARRGIVYLNRERLDLRDDPCETVGFELLLPELARQARDLGLRLPYDDWAFVESIRANKLQRIPPIAVYGGPTTLTTSLEYLGERLLPQLVDRCQAANGSYGTSPSATAYVFGQRQDPAAESYLREVASIHRSGGVLFLYPFELFETAWVLYYLHDMALERRLLEPHLSRLKAGWKSSGASWTGINGSVPDVDDTAVALRMLRLHESGFDADIFQQYEAEDHFYTFPFERDASTSSNAHVLEAIRLFPSTSDQRRMAVKIVHFLGKARLEEQYWMDKWHASPLYATNQAIRALAGFAPELVRPAVEWLLATQHESGSWGFGEGTVEESALGLSSLMVAAEADPTLRALAKEALGQGGPYLCEKLEQSEHPALWRGKSLFTPHNIVRAITLGAAHRWLTQFAEEPS
jgi:halimadienyl-diphosphate synthase